MKYRNAIGILTVLVSSMVLMSGCTTSDSPGAVPVATTIPQTVHETEPVPLIPASEITTSAPTILQPTITLTATPKQVTTNSVSIPSSGVWVKVRYSGNFSGSLGTPGVLKFVEDRGEHLYQISTIEGPVVVTIQKSDGSTAELAVDVYKDGTLREHETTTSPRGIVEVQTSVKTVTLPTTAVTTQNNSGDTGSKDTENNPVPALSVEENTLGSLYIHIRAGNCGPDLKAFIAREGTSVSPIIYYYLPDKTVVEGANIGYYQAKILVDGNSDMVKLLPGSYTAYLPNMNGGEFETQSFIISPGDRTDIWFSGYSIAASARGCAG